MIKRIKIFWTHSITRQLILGIALVHAVLMTIFVLDLVNRQAKFLKQESKNQTLGLTKTLAANSVPWVLSRDFMGMEEIMKSQAQQPNMIYAMIIAPSGEVLSHTNLDNVGLNINDSLSLSLLKSKKEPQILIDNNIIIDVASPIFSDEKFIGWARVGISQKVISDGLATITMNGIWYTILAIVVGSLFAIIIGRGITSGLRDLVLVADKIRAGDEEVRILLNRNDELGKLGLNLNAMIDSIIMQKNIIKDSQEKIITSLKEKEILLKEVHHRVKNNFQVISSLINLQTSSIENENILNSLKDINNRIKSMSLIHELMYSTEDFVKISLNDYINKLMAYLRSSYLTNDANIKTNLEIEEVPIQLDDLIPIGLILNELISNSFKHAFPNERDGEILVVFKQFDKDNYILSIKDSGIGIPKDFDMQRSKSLGMLLVSTLTRQLHGEIEISALDVGTEIIIKFELLV